MTKILKSILIIFFLFASFISDAQQNGINFKQFLDHKPNLREGREVFIEPNFNKYDILFQELNFELNPSVYYIKGEVLVVYKAFESLDSLMLNLSDSLIVDSILQNDLQLSFEHQGGMLKINIQDINSEAIDSLRVYYQGAPDESQQAFFIGVQDSVSFIPVLATLSEPYGSSDWWPCKDNLIDKIDSIDINVTVPLGNQAVSQGFLTDVDTNGAFVTYHWKHRFPVTPYLVSIAVSDYVEYHSYLHTLNNDSVLFMNFLYYNNLDNNKARIDDTEKYFKVYDSLFISYPFLSEKYGHVEFPVGGGMEHQTISSMGTFDFGIISHELAHQWFGDYVTCGSWEDLWLNEGFASYCVILCYEKIFPNTWYPIGKKMVVAAITVDSTGSVFPIDTSNINGLFSSRLTYHKASYLLHMIRWLIGDEHFFQAIRNYLNDEDLAFSFARTPNLISYFEQEADTSLSYFMDDWFYGEGYPIYNIEWSQDENLHFYTSISQSDAALNNHFFALDVPLRLLGQSDTLDVRFKNTTNHQMFTELVDFEVDSVIFDPEYWLISKYSSVQLSIDLKTSSSPIRIYPNPTDDLLFFDSEYNLKDLKVYNINGQECNVLRNQNMIKVSNLHAGVYYCSYSINGNLYSQKFIKQ